MQQIKIFKSLEYDVKEVETAVNTWLVESDVRVISIFGNIAPQSHAIESSSPISKGAHVPSDVMLVVLYEQD